MTLQIQQYQYLLMYMQKFSELTINVRMWNMMGYSLLPSLQIAFITNTQNQSLTERLLAEFHCRQRLYRQEQGGVRIYEIYRMEGKVEGRFHILEGLSSESIKDEIFKKRRSAIQKLRKNTDVIFMRLRCQEEYNDRLQEMNLWLNREKDKVRIKDIVIENSTSSVILYHDLLNRYEILSRFQLIGNFMEMKKVQKQFKKEAIRYKQWKKVIDKQIDPNSYGFNCFQNYQRFVISSLQGVYRQKQDWMKEKSLRWEIMELIEEVLQMEGEQIMKKVDSMPLTFIEEQYKMSNYQSIGGFLSDTCFQNIFSPPLVELQEIILETLSASKLKILQYIQDIIIRYFEHINIQPLFKEKQLNRIEEIIDNFLSQSENSIKSQIDYIYAPSEEFWSYRSIHSNLYTFEQQIYIQIKYIGKAYVRKIYQTLKDTVPRYVGQNLLKNLVNYIQTGSFISLIQIISENPFQLTLSKSQIQRYQKIEKESLKMQKIVNFFSLRISNSLMIKNFHQKNQKHWRQMFGPKNQQQIIQQQNDQKGFFIWIKNIFKKKSQNNTNSKRVKSQQKKSKIQKMQNQSKPDSRVYVPTISSKQWLLIINTDRKIDLKKLELGSKQGFPPRLRSSIWLYLTRIEEREHNKIKVKQLLKEEIDKEIKKQIRKDVIRTSPHQLFRGVLKDSMTRILQAYSIFDKQIGYTQGMNFIVGVIMCTLIGYGQKQIHYIDKPIQKNNLQLEQKSFTIFKYLMFEKGLRKVMLMERQMLADICWRLDQAIKEKSIKVYQLIISLSFTTEMIFSSPLLSGLSAHNINPLISRRIFDMMMVSGYVVVHKVIAEFIKNAQDRILSMNPEMVYQYLKINIYEDIYNFIGEEGLTRMFKNM